MSCVATDRRLAAGMFALALLLGVGEPAWSQEGDANGSRSLTRIIASEIGISRDQAELRLELEDGRAVTFEIREGAAWMNDERLGAAPRGESLDRSWRELLNAAMDAPTDELASLLVSWDAPSGETGVRLDSALESVLVDQDGSPPVVRNRSAANAADTAEQWASDTVARLNERIAELEARLEKSRGDHGFSSGFWSGGSAESWWSRPFRRIFRGIAEILSTLAVYGVMVGIGFAAVFFGRQYLEGVADTARHATVQSGLVGLAATFLVVPVFILGAITLTISIVGIPALVVWLPLFPVAVMLAALFGYLGVAHAAGEALAERRFKGTELFKRANSYYYVLTGVGLLFVLYIAATIFEMVGPWLDFLSGLLLFFAVMLTWAAITIGFGAVLLSRAGTRPKVTRPGEPEIDVDQVFEEESHV